MRTPRDILLKHHQAAQRKLDAMRENVEREHLVPVPAASLSVTRDTDSSDPRGARVHAPTWWRDLFDLPRGAWAALGAAWIVIIALNVASSESSPSPRAEAGTAPRRSPEMLQALREQKRLFAELVGGEAADAAVRRFVPRPRSEAPPQTLIA